MKIIHSFWSKPGLSSGPNQFKGVWINKKYNYISWALSCLQLTKFYDNVELITDKKGKEIFINKLCLPYTNVQVVLNQLDKYHPQLWGMSKIYSYNMQQEPFLHVDGDVYIWKRFDSSIESSPISAQHLEENFDYYERMIQKIKSDFSYVPDFLINSWKGNNIFAYNSGILGGTDYDFFNQYAEETIHFIDKNHKDMDIEIARRMAVFDQHFFYCYAKHKSKAANVLISHMDEEFTGLGDLQEVPNKTTFVHLLYAYKQNKKSCEQLESRLQKDYPDYYYRIIDLLNRYEI